MIGVHSVSRRESTKPLCVHYVPDGDIDDNKGARVMERIGLKVLLCALIAAISGEVDVAFSGVAGAVQFVQSGRLRALGVTSLKPVAALPGVPTIAESGLPGYEFVAWFLLAAPKGTPREIIVTLNEHFRKAMTFADTIKRFEAEGLDAVGSSPEQAAATMESELKKYAVLIRERGMKAD